MDSPRALVIEDATDTARLIEFHLRKAGFDVQIAGTGADGLARAVAWRPRVVVLDIRLPDIDGFEVCARLRDRSAATAEIGVLMLTAQGITEDRIKAFERGADDFMLKPFSARELALRVTALARRLPEPAAGTPQPALAAARCGPIELDPRALEVRVSGELIELRPSEIRLLQVLMESPGVVLSRKELLRRVWGQRRPMNQRVVDVVMHRLRGALGEHGSMIETILEGGYRLRCAS